ncbi:MAG: WD40 repeat domain-containing protein, partial [Holophagaceae bacterium]|nr:WD40 repeat domain-containing protein [Holophagaceae bacterium]
MAWAALVGLIVLPALLQGTLKAYGSRSTPDAVLRGEKASVEALLFSGNGGALAAGDSGGHLTVWNVAGRSKRGSKSVKGEVLSLSLHPHLPAYFATTPKTLVIGGFQPGFESRLKENEVSIKVIYWFWSQNMEYQVQVVDWGNAYVSRRSNDASFEISSKMKVNRSIAISADSQTLICRFDNRMSEFDLDSGRIIRDLDFGEPVPALQFAPDGRLFGAYGFTDGKVDAAYGWFDPA